MVFTPNMITSVCWLIGALTPVAWAASATIFPVGLGPEASLQGQIIGSGGEVGTTYVLSGETLGLTFTLTLAQDESLVAEKVSIPTRSFDLNVGCFVTAGNAVCQNVVVSAGATSTFPLTTLPYSPFAVPVSTSGVVATSTSSALETSASSASSAPATGISDAAGSSSEVGTGVSTATLVSPSASESSTSNASRNPIVVWSLLLHAIAVLWAVL